MLCFLDNKPSGMGHCLLIPKKHYKDIYSIDDKHARMLLPAAKKISLVLKQKLGASGINILHASGKTAQQSVFHFHIHIVPRYKNDKLDAWLKSNYVNKDIECVYRRIKGKRRIS
jgi:histidine triad (HIT) family protein